MLKLVLEVRTLCPWNTSSQVVVEVDFFGCRLVEVLSNCFISDHIVCFLEYILFHSLPKGRELNFKIILAFYHAKLN